MACDLFPISEQNHCRDAPDSVAGANELLILSIQLGQAHTGFQDGCSLFESRSHGKAGATPGGPEIHQHGDIVFRDVTVKIGAIQFQGMRSEHRGFALSTAGMVLQTIGRQGID
jgi:hypothetical protein